MPVTHETRLVLDARKQFGAAEIQTLTPQEARDQMSRMREAMGPVKSEEVARVADRRIPGPAGEVPVRIYWPGDRGPFPLYVFFHGGGWVIGDLDSHDATCRSIANLAQACVVSVDYRLAPEHRYPAASEDCYAATRWAVDHAAELQGDASKLIVGGDSAGGHLAAVVALMARDRGGPPISAQLLVYPVTNHDFTTESYRQSGTGEYGLSEAGMRWFWECYLADAAEGAHPYASPLRAPDLSGLPRALVITAEYDPLRDEGEAYGKRLQAAGVPTTVKRFDGVVHGFLGQAAVVPEARRALELIGAEVRALVGVPAR